MLNFLSMAIIITLFLIVAVLGLIDKKKKRNTTNLPKISFMVPCYNDAASVDQTIKSIYEVCDANTDVIVIDDCSTDTSQEKLHQLKKKLGFKLILNQANIGKSKTLNDNFHLTKNDIVVFSDADVIVNKDSLIDAISRLTKSDVGAVSCPYRGENKGFIPLMQTIEYNMLSFVQGAYNVFSAIALWGGFIVIKREAFLDAGKFSLNAITEDMDLAFKLNKNGWRVEQSFKYIRTYVPETINGWFRQKIRWSAGGFQCFMKYYGVWFRNPLHILFLSTFCILTIFSTLKLGNSIFLWDDIIDYFIKVNRYESIWISLQLTVMLYGVSIVKGILFHLYFTLFSLPFVLPLVSTIKQLYLFLIIVPFSIFYVPFFSIISILGAAHYFKKRHSLEAGNRAW
jgi:biofilm PGA synthesis N-glycosyltransferase PgaC